MTDTALKPEKLTPQSKGFLQLILRSPDIGGGWRQCSSLVWPLVGKFSNPELLEIDEENMRVRLSDSGIIVGNYL